MDQIWPMHGHRQRNGTHMMCRPLDASKNIAISNLAKHCHVLVQKPVATTLHDRAPCWNTFHTLASTMARVRCVAAATLCLVVNSLTAGAHMYTCALLF